jgi:hypothetical protein
MAKRPDLSAAQRKIVDRYYEHRDTIWATKLADLVGEIALATDHKKLDKLWKSAGEYLSKCGADAATIARIAGARDTKLLAQAAGQLMNTGRIAKLS